MVGDAVASHATNGGSNVDARAEREQPKVFRSVKVPRDEGCELLDLRRSCVRCFDERGDIQYPHAWAVGPSGRCYERPARAPENRELDLRARIAEGVDRSLLF